MYISIYFATERLNSIVNFSEINLQFVFIPKQYTFLTKSWNLKWISRLLFSASIIFAVNQKFVTRNLPLSLHLGSLLFKEIYLRFGPNREQIKYKIIL